MLAGAGVATPKIGRRAELLAYWKAEGLVGTKPDIPDAAEHARALRRDAEALTFHVKARDGVAVGSVGQADIIIRMSKPLVVTVRCHFDGRSLVPDEPVDLLTGEALIAHLERETVESPTDGRSSLAALFENAVNDDSLPVDLSRQHDHYLYGTPKKP